MLNGLTFDERYNTAKNDGSIYHRIFKNDGRIKGCEVSFTANDVRIQAGYFAVHGRAVEIEGEEIVDVMPDIQTGYMRLKYRVDLNNEPSSVDFTQGAWAVEYAATTTFLSLVQEDINSTGKIYEMEAAIFRISGGSITELTADMANAEIDADKLGGQPGGYYGTKAAVDRAQATADAKANLQVSIVDANNILTQPALSNTNTPGGYYFIIPINWTGNVSQLAIPYRTNNGQALYYRVLDGTWREWQRMMTSGEGMPKAGGTFTGGVTFSNIETAFPATGNDRFSYLVTTAESGFDFRVPGGDGADIRVRILHLRDEAHGYEGSIRLPTSTDGELALCSDKGIACTNGDATGYQAIYATAFTERSSRRYKENILDMLEEDAAKLLDVQVKTYKYKADSMMPTDKRYEGVIAEEVHELGLQSVVSYNDEGQPEAVDYSKFVPRLIKLCQMQDKRISELEKRLEASK